MVVTLRRKNLKRGKNGGSFFDYLHPEVAFRPQSPQKGLGRSNGGKEEFILLQAKIRSQKDHNDKQ